MNAHRIARLTGLAAAIALLAALAGMLTAVPSANAEQTPAPQCYDVRECSFTIKRLVIEADNLRSDVARLQRGVDGANAELANNRKIYADNLAGRDRDIERLQRALDAALYERDTARATAAARGAALDVARQAAADAIAERDAALLERDVAETDNARLRALVADLRARLAIPTTRCRNEDSRGCVWHAPSSGNGKGRSFYTTVRGETKQISHARAARLIGYAD